MRRPERIAPGAGQESVWDYPRPPALEQTRQRLRVVFAGIVIAETTRGWRVLETSHPPVYYFPADDVRGEALAAVEGTSYCEWKGVACYHDVVVGVRRAPRAAWRYTDPVPAFAAISDHVAFYAQPMDSCFVGDERVRPQPGGFYGGWITDAVTGPFKGEPGTAGW